MVKITQDILITQIRDLVTSPFLHVLVWMVVLDIITGYVKAVKTKTIDSKVSTNGWLRHIVVLIIVILVGVYARVLGQQIFSIAVCCGFIGSYGLSLLENLEAIGVWFPQSFKALFKQMRDRKINVPTVDGNKEDLGNKGL